jgi:hypothetical protein
VNRKKFAVAGGLVFFSQSKFLRKVRTFLLIEKSDNYPHFYNSTMRAGSWFGCLIKIKLYAKIFL